MSLAGKGRAMRSLKVVTLVSFLWIIAGCSGRTAEEQRIIQATSEAVGTLTASHEQEVRSLIENYYMMSGSLEAQQNPTHLSTVMTGPILESMLSSESPDPEAELYINRSVDLTEIYVLEYTSSSVKAIGCGKLYSDRVTYEGEVVATLQPQTLMNVYVFMSEAGTWKLFTQYTFVDPKSDLRDWEYVSDEEKQAIGDLQSYVDTYFPCGIS